MFISGDVKFIAFFAVTIASSPMYCTCLPPIRSVFAPLMIVLLSDKNVFVFVPLTNVDALPDTVSNLFSYTLVFDPPYTSSFLSPCTLKL